MKRYQTDVRNRTLHIETGDGWMEVGSMDDICELVGGEMYSIEYDERQRAADWSGADEDGTFTFDVPETLSELSYDKEFVANVSSVPLDETDDDGYPLRTSVFADMMMRIWDTKGNLEAE
ncbi:MULTISPECIES: hypothetical protein [unclassified Haladaptatus]|uniref:hypothetical protein n=1 Tax=unclassified Haladaptatus TaxID=2622732 RepID=UPI00209C0641|nr:MULTISPECIES: hypothetical protein [unclassified Haladaptatus]MCO8244803.1 hypothetical protein [Haladaptatus sp. AB643]MCO8255685.1 hypothetical protein [Haladaptatus sp. AB618]